MAMTGDVAYILSKKLIEETMAGAGAIKGEKGDPGAEGFSPSITENANNTDDVYKLDIETKDGTFTTPNLKGQGGVVDGYTHYVKIKGKTGISYYATSIECSDLNSVLNTGTPCTGLYGGWTVDSVESSENDTSVLSGFSIFSDRKLTVTPDFVSVDAFYDTSMSISGNANADDYEILFEWNDIAKKPLVTYTTLAELNAIKGTSLSEVEGDMCSSIMNALDENEELILTREYIIYFGIDTAYRNSNSYSTDIDKIVFYKGPSKGSIIATLYDGTIATRSVNEGYLYDWVYSTSYRNVYKTYKKIPFRTDENIDYSQNLFDYLKVGERFEVTGDINSRWLGMETDGQVEKFEMTKYNNNYAFMIAIYSSGYAFTRRYYPNSIGGWEEIGNRVMTYFDANSDIAIANSVVTKKFKEVDGKLKYYNSVYNSLEELNNAKGSNIIFDETKNLASLIMHELEIKERFAMMDVESKYFKIPAELGERLLYVSIERTNTHDAVCVAYTDTGKIVSLGKDNYDYSTGTWKWKFEDITIDDTLDASSTNAIQNKAVAERFAEIEMEIEAISDSDITVFNNQSGATAKWYKVTNAPAQDGKSCTVKLYAQRITHTGHIEYISITRDSGERYNYTGSITLQEKTGSDALPNEANSSYMVIDANNEIWVKLAAYSYGLVELKTPNIAGSFEIDGSEGTPTTDYLFSMYSERGKTVAGADGKSAYQIWLDAGNTGTEADFLTSLKGNTGETGPQGIPGVQGIPGEKGEPGEPGATPTIKAAAGANINTVGTPSVTASTSGTTTTFTFNNLKGASGTNGTTPTIKAAAGSNINTVGTPSVTASTSGTTTTFTFNNLKGATGAAGTNGTTPTIKAAAGSNINTVGTPTVTASTSGTTTTFTFDNLKGATGATGAAGEPGYKRFPSTPGVTTTTGVICSLDAKKTVVLFCISNGGGSLAATSYVSGLAFNGSTWSSGTKSISIGGVYTIANTGTSSTTIKVDNNGGGGFLVFGPM